MTDKELLLKIKDIIYKFLPKDTKIFLFGSRVTGKNSLYSDYDIGILSNKKNDLLTIAKIKNELEDLPTLYKIDLVDFSSTSKEFDEIAKQKVLYL